MGILYIVLGAAYLVNPKGVLRWAKVSDNPSTAFVLFSRLIGLWGILGASWRVSSCWGCALTYGCRSLGTF